jgi:hypothetical protein
LTGSSFCESDPRIETRLLRRGYAKFEYYLRAAFHPIRRDTMATVLDQYGHEVDYEAAVAKMDKALKEQIEKTKGDCPPQEFFEAYYAAHELRFGEEFKP